MNFRLVFQQLRVTCERCAFLSVFREALGDSLESEKSQVKTFYIFADALPNFESFRSLLVAQAQDGRLLNYTRILKTLIIIDGCYVSCGRLNRT